MSDAYEGLLLDEERLKAAVLKAYHERRNDPSRRSRLALAAVRQLLSGAPGGEVGSLRFWFEEDPRASLASFLVDLDGVEDGLARWACEPLLEAFARLAQEPSPAPALDASLLVASAAGPLALRADLDETLAAGILAACALAALRLGPRALRQALAAHEREARP